MRCAKKYILKLALKLFSITNRRTSPYRRLLKKIQDSSQNINFKTRPLRNKGQTILEVVIAAGILSTVLAGIMTLMINVAHYGSNTEARSLAINYTQEAIDVVKNIRDNNYCSFFNYTSGNYDIKLNAANNEWGLIPVTTNPPRVALTDAGSANANMTRQIQMIEKTFSPHPDTNVGLANRYINVIVTVRWQFDGSQEEIYTASTDLYKWKY